MTQNGHSEKRLDSFKSNIAIDLGGQHTGVVSYTAKDIPTPNDINAFIVEMPVNGENGLVYTMTERTAVRHRIRSGKRFTQARRLLQCLCASLLTSRGEALSKPEKEALSSLLKRRGYTRIESEVDTSILQSIDAAPLSPVFEDNGEPVQIQLESILEDRNRLIDTNGQLGKLDIKEILARFPEIKEQKRTYEQAIKTLKTCVSSCLQQEEFGHKHRTTYLEDIRQDMVSDSRLFRIANILGGMEQLWHLVGNLSNLQLRALRWYFNDPAMKTGDIWDENRFRKVWIRAYQYFHYTDEAERRKVLGLLSRLSHSEEGTVDLLCSVSPYDTIPPYEDQNNRRPPIDQTLLLNPKAMDEAYGSQWEIWANNLLAACPMMEDGLDEVIAYPDRKSRNLEEMSGLQENQRHYTSLKLRNSYVLQRFLDRSMDKDPYQLRRLATGRKASVTSENLVKLTYDLGSQHIKAFLDFAQRYYSETDKARRGIWVIENHPLLEMSGIHPPMKKKVLIKLVESIVGAENLTRERFNQAWRQKIKGNSTACSLCRGIETLRKEYGNAFNYELNQVTEKQKQKEKLDKEEKGLLRVKETVDLVSHHLAHVLGLDESKRERFSNPFSLAQLYNLLETDVNGFTRNTRAVLLENAWRMTGAQGEAICSRLPAESVRPFDGALRRILDRQAYEIAKRKADEIRGKNLSDTSIDIGILIESNQFAFTASLADIKNSPTKKRIKDKMARAEEGQVKRWQKKSERIKEASHGICPYTGKTLDANGEIDHIIPRSQTLAQTGAVYNAEANLIYCSQEGNQTKSNTRKTLADLSPKYLSALYGTADYHQIEETISRTVDSIAKNTTFDSLSAEEQRDLRHALFLPGSEAYQKAVERIRMGSRTRVNGTQAWFIRQIMLKLTDLLAQWCADNRCTLNFDAWRIDSETVHQYRKQLGKAEERLTKQEIQTVASHAIDALCVLGAAYGNEAIREKIGGNPAHGDENDIKGLLSLAPHHFELGALKKKSLLEKDDAASRALFKDGIYAEHFLPVMCFKDQVRIGFDWGKADGSLGNCIALTQGTDIFLNAIAPFFDTPLEENPPTFRTYHIDKQKAFRFLHFIATEPATPEQLVTASLLESLFYTTQNCPLMGTVYDATKKKLAKRADVVNDKDFAINVKVPGRQIKQSGNRVFLPVKREWERLYDAVEKQAWETDIEKKLFNYLKERSSKPSRQKHKATRRVWSLPRCASVSGGIRIRRSTSDGRDVYQLVAVGDFKSSGFAVTDEKNIEWKTTIPAGFLKSRNLTLKNRRYNETTQIVRMNHELITYQDESLIVKVSPGTADRRNVTVTESFESLRQWYRQSDSREEIDINHLNGKLPVAPNQLERFYKQHPDAPLGTPRTDNKKMASFTVIAFGLDSVTYSYPATGAVLNQSYENAFKRSSGKS